MKIGNLVEESLTRSVIVHCPTYKKAETFLKHWWWASNKKYKESTLKTILRSHTRLGSETCFNIKEGRVYTISRSYVEKYGLEYDYVLISCSDIEGDEVSEKTKPETT